MTAKSPPQWGAKDFLIKWTPRAIAVAFGGYYGLGIAYEYGIMAAIDKVAMQVIKHFAGYAGIGVLMPTVQWYAALAARIIMGLAAGVIYDLAERSALFIGRGCYDLCQSTRPKSIS